MSLIDRDRSKENTKTSFDMLEERANGPPRRVLFADGDEARVREAIQILASSRLVRPIALGASSDAPLPASIERLDPVTIPSIERYRAELSARLGVAPRVAAKLLERRVNLALALLGDGVADALVVGVESHTADVLVACEMMLGLSPGTKTASSLFILEVPPLGSAPARVLAFADCAIHPNPSAEQLADIAIASAEGTRAFLGVEPRVAMLSFSSHGSAVGQPDVEKVIAATALVRTRDPGLAIEGELQADAALDSSVASHKLAESLDGASVAGNANVLVFPDLDAGNIGYKLVRSLAGATAAGAFLQGYGKPVAKMSRGATTGEIVATARLLAASTARR